MNIQESINHILKNLRGLPKRLWPLAPWTIFFTGLALAFCVEASALVIHLNQHKTAIHHKSATATSMTSPLVPVNRIVTPTAPASQNTSSQPKTTGNAAYCTKTEGIIAQGYSSMLDADWSAWSNETAKYTPAEINYEYDQSAQSVYNQEVQALQSDGCASHLTLALKYPATNPYGSTAAPSAPAAPTCDTSLEASYENSYNDQYQILVEQENQEIQNVQYQIALAGGGPSSAYYAVPSEVAQQYSSKFTAIQNTLNSELASINC